MQCQTGLGLRAIHSLLANERMYQMQGQAMIKTVSAGTGYKQRYFIIRPENSRQGRYVGEKSSKNVILE